MDPFALVIVAKLVKDIIAANNSGPGLISIIGNVLKDKALFTVILKPKLAYSLIKEPLKALDRSLTVVPLLKRKSTSRALIVASPTDIAQTALALVQNPVVYVPIATVTLVTLGVLVQKRVAYEAVLNQVKAASNSLELNRNINPGGYMDQRNLVNSYDLANDKYESEMRKRMELEAVMRRKLIQQKELKEIAKKLTKETNDGK